MAALVVALLVVVVRVLMRIPDSDGLLPAFSFPALCSFPLNILNNQNLIQNAFFKMQNEIKAEQNKCMVTDIVVSAAPPFPPHFPVRAPFPAFRVLHAGGRAGRGGWSARSDVFSSVFPQPPPSRHPTSNSDPACLPVGLSV